MHIAKEQTSALGLEDAASNAALKFSVPAAEPVAKSTAVVPLSLDALLQDARCLLDYAARTGIKVPQPILDTLIQIHDPDDISPEDQANLYVKVTELAAMMRPVTAETLRVRTEDARPTLRWYKNMVFCLGPILLILSVWSFIAAGFSTQLQEQISQANQLALELNTNNLERVNAKDDLIEVPKTLESLQRFAASVRAVRQLSSSLGWLVFTFKLPENIQDDQQFEVGLPVTYEQIWTTTRKLQEVRGHANVVQVREKLWSGAITNCILPIFYAILGACAYLLKTFSEQMRARTYLPSDPDWARLTIAAIAGGVIGLFSNYNFTEGTSLSLLALAFLVGYGTDVFFSFLDNLQQVFTRGRANPPPTPTGPPLTQ